MNRKARRTLRILIIPLTISVGAAIASDYSIDWYTIDGGGEMFCTGGDFELSGTAGQPDAAVVMTGADFELTGGFWALGGRDHHVVPRSLIDLVVEAAESADGEPAP